MRAGFEVLDAQTRLGVAHSLFLLLLDQDVELSPPSPSPAPCLHATMRIMN